VFAAKTPNILRKFAENRRGAVDSDSLRRTEEKFYWSRCLVVTNGIFAAPNGIFAVKLAMGNEQLTCNFTSLKVHFPSNNRTKKRQITE
jgi:hypothetical protein